MWRNNQRNQGKSINSRFYSLENPLITHLHHNTHRLIHPSNPLPIYHHINSTETKAAYPQYYLGSDLVQTQKSTMATWYNKNNRKAETLHKKTIYHPQHTALLAKLNREQFRKKHQSQQKNHQNNFNTSNKPEIYSSRVTSQISHSYENQLESRGKEFENLFSSRVEHKHNIRSNVFPQQQGIRKIINQHVS